MIEFMAYVLARIIAGVVTAVILAALFQQYSKMISMSGTATATL